MYDAIVIGGGIVGMSTAYHLVRDGAKTLLLDRRDSGRATDAGAGILSGDTFAGDSLARYRLGIEAYAYYDVLATALRQAGCDSGYATCGMLMVAPAPELVQRFERVLARIVDRMKGRVEFGSDEFREITPARARELFPPLGEMSRVLFHGNAGRVEARVITDAMEKVAIRGGLTIRRHSVTELIRDGSRLTGVGIGDTTCHADNVVIAGGAWSRDFGEQLGVEIPVRPQRGQIIHLSPVDQPTGLWPVVSVVSENYLVPFEGARVVVGATHEDDAGFSARVTVGGVQKVLDDALRIAPGLIDAEIIETRAGLRPIAPDGLPVIGDVPGIENAYVSTAHGANGIMLGPYSGKLIADRIAGRDVTGVLDAFHLSRFAG